MNEIEDTEENYRKYLANLISQTKSRGGTRYYNQYVNKCREQAAERFPLGSKSARSDSGPWAMAILIIAITISVLLALSKKL
jgi:hypothetical protein